MPTLAQFWLETGAMLAALVIIPLYMGIIHVSPTGAVAYAAVGGLAMALGEELQFGARLLAITIEDVLLWTLSIAGAGGIAYLLALALL